MTSIPQLNSLTSDRVLLCLVAIALITLANLRGIKESGRIFAMPTYLYIVMLTGLVGWGLAHEFSLFGLHPFPTISFFNVTKDLPPAQIAELHKQLGIGATTAGTLGLFTLLRGFSSGAVALTGVEAISNGVPAFQRNESRNAAITLVWMAVILGGLFLGVSVLAHHLQPIPLETGRVGVLADGSYRLRKRIPVLRAAGCDGSDPHPRGEHGLRRLPATVVDHRPRRLSPAPAREPRRSPGLQ